MELDELRSAYVCREVVTMADAEADEPTNLRQDPEQVPETEPHEPGAVDAVDSSSPEGAPQDEAEAPAEPDGNPAVEATPPEATADQANADDGQAAEANASEEATSGVSENLTARGTDLRVGRDIVSGCITFP